jgi:hypothetical protein
VSEREKGNDMTTNAWTNLVKAVATNEMTLDEAAKIWGGNFELTKRDLMDGVEDWHFVQAAHKHTPAPWFNSSCTWPR